MSLADLILIPLAVYCVLTPVYRPFRVFGSIARLMALRSDGSDLGVPVGGALLLMGVESLLLGHYVPVFELLIDSTGIYYLSYVLICALLCALIGAIVRARDIRHEWREIFNLVGFRAGP